MVKSVYLIKLLKTSGRLEDAELSEPASNLAALAEELSQNDRLLTVAAQWLGRGPRTLDQMVWDGEIPLHLIGGRSRFVKMGISKETKLRA